MKKVKRTIDRLPSYLHFDIGTYKWLPNINYRKYQEKYRVGIGEQGVLICQPYKSQIGQYWKFKTENIARESAAKIFALFNEYLLQEDFVGADMSRKYLQMGFTRARRYANYKGGNKYDKQNNYALKERGTGDDEKARSAAVFFEYWKLAENDPVYMFVKAGWKNFFG